VKPTEGLFPGISREHYGKIDAINQSLLKIARQKSWAHMREEQLHPTDTGDAKPFGDALHQLIMEPARFHANFCSPAFDGDGHRWKKTTIKGKAAWAAWEEEHAGKTIIDFPTIKHAWKKLFQIQRAVEARHGARAIINSRGLTECGVVWQDAETGIWCKALIDRIELDRPPCHHLWDLKSARSAHPWNWAGDVVKFGYHFQAGFYLMGCDALEPRERRFGFLVVEKEAPFVVKPWLCKPSVIVQGQHEARVMLRQYAACLDSGKWPAYGEEIEEFNLPEWAYREIG